MFPSSFLKKFAGVWDVYPLIGIAFDILKSHWKKKHEVLQLQYIYIYRSTACMHVL